MRIALTMGLLLSLCFCAQEQGATLVREVDAPFDVDLLGELTPYRSDLTLNNRYLILIYMPEISCGACSDRELIAIAQKYQDDYPFMLVAAKSKNIYLRNIRRVLKFHIPMALEAWPGQLKLHAHFQLSLIDVARGRILLQYFPEPSPNTARQLDAFLTRAKQLMI